MDTQKQLSRNSICNREFVDHAEDVPLPGFRFHPLDEELVGFYLQRKVEKKPISLELIKEIDIYKYDPWDLPKGSNGVDKEWYFFSRRGRKHRNSIRPNRVTGSGFWKATGIDRPVYSGDGSKCIGLKKSLVYYRGSAGKGTKTEWMMHEFRLPPQSDIHNNKKHMDDKSVALEARIDRPVYSGDGSKCIGLKKSLVYYRGSAGKGTKTEWMMHEFHLPPQSDIHNNKKHMDDKSVALEAEVWTLCRILKRSPCYKKALPEWREVSTRKPQHVVVETSSGDSDYDMQSYISFQTPIINDKKPFLYNHHQQHHHETNQFIVGQAITLTLRHDQPPSTTASCSSFSNADVNEFIKHGDWDDLRSVVDQFGY